MERARARARARERERERERERVLRTHGGVSCCYKEKVYFHLQNVALNQCLPLSPVQYWPAPGSWRYLLSL